MGIATEMFEAVNNNVRSIRTKKTIIREVASSIADQLEMSTFIEKIVMMKVRQMEAQGRSKSDIEEELSKLDADELGKQISSMFVGMEKEMELETLRLNAAVAKEKSEAAEKALADAIAGVTTPAASHKANAGTVAPKTLPEAEAATKPIISSMPMAIPAIGAGRTWSAEDNQSA